MSRWINADAMESTLQEMEMITAMTHIEFGEEDDDVGVGEISMPIFTVRNIMKTAPSIDLVRCKECRRWWGNHYHDNEDGKCPMDAWIDGDGFCSYAEREGE